MRYSLPLLRYFVYAPAHPRHLHSFPTRRSSDLPDILNLPALIVEDLKAPHPAEFGTFAIHRMWRFEIRSEDTRLNSSHVSISYAVFCLKKKKNSYCRTTPTRSRWRCPTWSPRAS